MPSAPRLLTQIEVIQPEQAERIDLGFTAGECHLRNTSVCSLSVQATPDNRLGDAGYDYCRYLADHLQLHAFISQRMADAMPTDADGMEALIRSQDLQAAIRSQWRPPFGTVMGEPARAIENALRLYAPMTTSSPVELRRHQGELRASDGRHRLCVAGKQRLALHAKVELVDAESLRIRERFNDAAEAIYEQRWSDALPILEEVVVDGDLDIATRACRDLAWAHRTLRNWPDALDALRSAVRMADSGIDGLSQVMTRRELVDSCRQQGDLGAEIEAHVDATHASRLATRLDGLDGLCVLAEQASASGDRALGAQLSAALDRAQLPSPARIFIAARLETVCPDPPASAEIG